MSLLISTPAFDFAEIAAFLGPRAVPSLELVSDDSYARSVRVEDRPVMLSISMARGGRGRAKLVVRTAPLLEDRVARRLVRDLFDLDTNLDAFRAHIAGDSILAPLVAARPNVRIPRYVDPFEGVVRAILGQQVSLAAARTMTDRLVRLTDVTAPSLDDLECLAFPSAQELLDLGETRLRGIGLTGAKTRALRATAEAVLSGALDWEWLAQADPDESQALLETVRGIGPWTAAYVRMRALGDRDAFPATDMGVIKAFARRAQGPGRSSGLRDQGSGRGAQSSGTSSGTRQIVERAERWRPWRAYATMQLWCSLE